ncbi:NAD-dependent epimerase/dehydratase family protein [Falsiroseomonas tokyonensis]|uniref:NAD-dependent epimerase/dehydratase family protein n=1 Tax=Falsiroseomonas tokyonensis TaxID=430521 RepID=A0ABV7BMC2_9PROT|nr:NAD-dependent epimerase/dehydratase family protein [Falsiroseomonas tokyonensis]
MALLLVTGGCGFIGSHLTAALLARGDRVRVLDDLSTGSRANLAPGATLVVGKVEDPETVRAAMEGVDGCFHLAAIASVARCTEAWLETHRVNLSATIAVLDAARAAFGRAAIPVAYASSAAIYGMPEFCPLDEDAPARPLSAYGADKLGCELHARVAGQVHGVPTIGLRFFNVYGPRQDPRSPYSGVISIFCERLNRGLPLAIHGDGRQTRDFVFVADVVAALLAALPMAETGAPVFNVCTGQPSSLLDLSAAIGRACGQEPRLEHQPARLGDIRHSVGSVLRARQALGLKPPVPLEEGLAAVIGWLRAGSPMLAEVPRGAAPRPPRRPQPKSQPRSSARRNQEATERQRMTAMDARQDQRPGT